MTTCPTVSVVVINYNYERYLRSSVASALGQTYSAVEVIAVDDGSTDGSREVLASFGDAVTPVYKSNGGMASAYNVGFSRCRGDFVLFLDADDVLLPHAIECAAVKHEETVAKIHWSMDVIDEHGRLTGACIPSLPLEEGDFRERTIDVGPDSYLSPPTSANLWSARFLRTVMPIPEDDYRRHVEMYLATLAPLHGTVGMLPDRLSLYRVHGRNDYASSPAEEKIRRNRVLFECRCGTLAAHLRRAGIEATPEQWIGRNAYYEWMRTFEAAVDELKAVVPPGSRFILIDDAQLADRWGGSDLVAERESIPFLERDGGYWGPPPDDAIAIAELDRLRDRGYGLLVIAWPSFWWLEHYADFTAHLGRRHRKLLSTPRVIVFDVR